MPRITKGQEYLDQHPQRQDRVFRVVANSRNAPYVVVENVDTGRRTRISRQRLSLPYRYELVD